MILLKSNKATDDSLTNVLFFFSFFVCLLMSLQKADVTSKAVVDVIGKTSEYLQPNPASRAKLTMLNTMSKIRGQVNSPGYPQPEGLLGESMTKYGRDIGEDNSFGKTCGAVLGM